MKNLDARPWGYLALLERYAIGVPESYHRSWIQGSRRVLEQRPNGEDEFFPPSYAKDDSDLGLLVFALKYDGLELLALRRIFAHIDRQELVQGILAKRSSAYLRRLWYLFEFFEEFGRLDIDDCPACPAVDLVDPQRYFVRKGLYASRQRVRVNLLGNKDWCPVVRKSSKLASFDAATLRYKASQAIEQIPPATAQRALRYLHTKETRASYEIESAAVQPRTQRFVETLIRQADPSDERMPCWNLNRFVEVQRALLDERYAEDGVRSCDVRISEQLNLVGALERVHWVGAPHAWVTVLMDGLIQAWAMHHAGAQTCVSDLPRSGEALDLDFVMAVCLSFGTVYIHPFGDGNGRIHRLLLSYVFAQTRLTPPGIVVPVSAMILGDRLNYDRILESHSRPAMEHMDYSIDPKNGEITVAPECAQLFRYIDFTPHVEQIADWFNKAIDEELVREVQTLEQIDRALQRMRSIVDMPDRKLQQFLQICHHNGQQPDSIGFRISKGKRKRLFAELTDGEVKELEEAIAEVFSAQKIAREG